MAQKFRYFVKLDANLKPVIGTNITRTKKPKGAGNWLEILPENCCNQTVTATPTSTIGDDISFSLFCGDVTLIDSAGISDSVGSAADIAEALQDAFPFLGTFTAESGDIVLEIGSAIGAVLCEYDTIEMTIDVS